MAPSVHGDPLAQAMGSAEVATRGQRVAGLVLIADAIVSTIVMTALPANFGAGRTLAVIFDVAIGVALAAGSGRFATWALARVVFGLLALLMMLVIARQNSALGAQQLGALAVFAVFALALLLLLVGEAGRARIVVGVTLAVVYLALACQDLLRLAGP